MSVAVATDGRTVHLELPLVTRRVYQITLVNVRSAEGEKLTNATAYYTLNRTRDGG